MQQPDGYVEPGKEHLVCKLKKSLYGLKQSPRCWNKAFQQYMELNGFQQSTADPCIFIRIVESSITIVAVYVDDLILITRTSQDMQYVKNLLTKQFKMEDMGKVHYCLGISVTYDEDRKLLWLHQRQYILHILEKYGTSEAKPTSTPADINVKMIQNDGISQAVDSSVYQSMVVLCQNSTLTQMKHTSQL